MQHSAGWPNSGNSLLIPDSVTSVSETTSESEPAVSLKHEAGGCCNLTGNEYLKANSDCPEDKQKVRADVQSSDMDVGSDRPQAGAVLAVTSGDKGHV